MKDHYFPPVKNEEVEVITTNTTGKKRKGSATATVKEEVSEEVQEFLNLLHGLSLKLGIELSIFRGTGKLKGLNKKPIGEIKAILNTFELSTDGDVKDLRLRVDNFISKKLKQSC